MRRNQDLGIIERNMYLASLIQLNHLSVTRRTDLIIIQIVRAHLPVSFGEIEFRKHSTEEGFWIQVKDFVEVAAYSL